jgi:glycosyltransferase involved in cell wall biosynthesis
VLVVKRASHVRVEDADARRVHASRMTTVHFVYPSGPSIACPHAIGRNVAARLRTRYRVRQYDWDDVLLVRPGPDDVLIGHPHPAPWTVFRMSSRLPGWKRIIALCPYAHGDPTFISFLDQVIGRCDLYLSITGSYWYRSVVASPFAHWSPKMVHVDLAIDPHDFPRVKAGFNPPGRRRFVYIGNTAKPKNTAYLSDIARRMPGTSFTWIGNGRRPIHGLHALGFHDFQTDSARRLVAEHDFLVTVGTSDANPTTILEAMAWGLIPVCSPQSGYDDRPGIVNVPVDDADAAAAILNRLDGASMEDLERLRSLNDAALRRHFHWDRFASQVIDAIESRMSPRLGAASLRARARLWMDSMTSPVSSLRPANFAHLARRNTARLVAGIARRL